MALGLLALGLALAMYISYFLCRFHLRLVVNAKPVSGGIWAYGLVKRLPYAVHILLHKIQYPTGWPPYLRIPLISTPPTPFKHYLPKNLTIIPSYTTYSLKYTPQDKENSEDGCHYLSYLHLRWSSVEQAFLRYL